MRPSLKWDNDCVPIMYGPPRDCKEEFVRETSLKMPSQLDHEAKAMSSVLQHL